MLAGPGRQEVSRPLPLPVSEPSMQRWRSQVILRGTRKDINANLAEISRGVKLK